MTSQEELSELTQKEELIMIISKLSAQLASVRAAFSRNKELPVENLEKQLRDLTEEIAFTAVRADEHLPGEPLRNRKSMFLYQSILSHLQIVVNLITALVEQLQKQLNDEISFYEKAVNQTDLLFTRQEMTLCTLEEAIRTGEEGHLRTVCVACNDLIRLCQRTAAIHEKCVLQGHCNPNTARHFLKFLDLMRMLVHHERETVRLLVRWKGKNWEVTK